MKVLSPRIIGLLIVAVIGILAVYPQTQYQPFLLQGDHGRDLYFYQITSQGAMPYKDFETANGPLMFYYYALFLKLFGGGIQSVLLGYAVMIFLAGMMVYVLTCQFLSPFISVLTALWYWAWRGNEFFYTFNHIGALVFLLATAASMIPFVKDSRKRFLVIGAASSGLCFLVRPDMGLASLFSLVVCSFGVKKMTCVRAWKVLAPVLLIALVLLFSGFLTLMRPYFQSIHHQNFIGNIVSLFQMRWSFCVQNTFMIIISCLFLFFSFRAVIMSFFKKHEDTHKLIFQCLAIVSVFCLMALMEYCFGVRFFRWVWATPFMVVIMFGLLEVGLMGVHRAVRVLVVLFLVSSCVISLASGYHEFYVSRKNNVVFELGPTKIYTGLDQKPWIETVSSTAKFIQDHVQQEEAVLPMIYDPIYAFLTERRFPVSGDVAFWGNRADQVIAQIESNHVKWIILSNRGFYHNDEEVFGSLGKDFGVNLVKYLADNYQVVYGVGPWKKRATQIYNHATRILVRKTPFK